MSRRTDEGVAVPVLNVGGWSEPFPGNTAQRSLDQAVAAQKRVLHSTQYSSTQYSSTQYSRQLILPISDH